MFFDVYEKTQAFLISKTMGPFKIKQHNTFEAQLVFQIYCGISYGFLRVPWGVDVRVWELEAHIERFRSSPVMHRDVPEECKPQLFKDGEEIDFAWARTHYAFIVRKLNSFPIWHVLHVCFFSFAFLSNFQLTICIYN